MDCTANLLMDRKVVRVVFLGRLAMVVVVTSPTTAGYSGCSAAVFVVVV